MNAPRTRYTGFTDAQARANKKYAKEKTDPVTIRFPKGFKQKIVDHVELTGESQAKFIARAIEETIARDREKAREALKHTLTETVQEPKGE